MVSMLAILVFSVPAGCTATRLDAERSTNHAPDRIKAELPILRIKLSVAKEVGSNDAVVASIDIVNVSPGVLHVFESDEPVNGFHLSVTNEHGEQVAKTDVGSEILARRLRRSAWTRPLNPGESWTTIVKLSEWFKLENGQAYRLIVECNVEVRSTASPTVLLEAAESFVMQKH